MTLIAEETSEHGFPGSDSGSGSGSGDTGLRQSPFARLVGRGAGRRAADSDSDFELTPSNVIDALQPDSGSDFELTALDPSDEFESTPLLGPSDSDVTAAEPGASGINLGRPSDSGINLLGVRQRVRPRRRAELDRADPPERLRDQADPRRPPRAVDREAGDAPARGKAEKDIFDDTDFEVDALGGRRRQDGAARAGQRLRARGGRVGLRGLRHRRGRRRPERGDRHEPRASSRRTTTASTIRPPRARCPAAPGTSRARAPRPPSARASSPILAPSAATAEWGGLWVGLLGVTTVFMLLLTFISMDLVRNLYDFQGGTPASGIVKSIAGLMGG